MEDWKEIADHSWPLLFLIVGGYGLFKLVKGLGMFLGNKLFDDDKGLLTLWFGDQRNLMGKFSEVSEKLPVSLDALTRSMTALTEDSAKSKTLLESLVNVHSDPDSLFATTKITKKLDLSIQAKIHLTEAEAALIAEDTERATELLLQARQLLEEAASVE